MLNTNNIAIITIYTHYNIIFWSKIFIGERIEYRIATNSPNSMILGAFERPESQHSNDGKNGKFASEHGKLHANWKDIYC